MLLAFARVEFGLFDVSDCCPPRIAICIVVCIWQIAVSRPFLTPRTDWIRERSMLALIIVTLIFNWLPRRHFQPEQGEVIGFFLLFHSRSVENMIGPLGTMSLERRRKPFDIHTVVTHSGTWDTFILLDFWIQWTNRRSFLVGLYRLSLVVRFRTTNVQLCIEVYFVKRPHWFAKR